MIDKSKNLSIKLSLAYADTMVNYIDHFYLIKTNFWRDFYPAKLDYQIKKAELNQVIKITYRPNELLYDESSTNNLKMIDLVQFKSQDSIPVEPSLGRFYPRGLLEKVINCYPEDARPFRVLAKHENNIDIDLNHPLSNFSLHLTTTIDEIYDAAQQNGGRCNDIVDLISNDGPGLQVLLSNKSSDYFSGLAFSRLIEDKDELFYQPLKVEQPVDVAALEELQRFYAPLIKNHSRILDLMSGSCSRLPENCSTDGAMDLDITGLGLIESELNDNPLLNQTTLHDINENPHLPYADKQFDLVICSFSVEYMIQPIDIFKEVARVLKPGGSFALGFSDRFYKQKVVSIWNDVHVFERMGLVLEYFRQSEQFSELQCESVRGKLRHQADPFINKTVYSCPMFMLKGRKL